MNSRHTLYIIIVGFLIGSCSENTSNNVSEIKAITEEEAVEIITAAMAAESAGLSETVNEFVSVYLSDISINIQCNEVITDSYNITKEGSLVQVSYTFDWEYLISCNNFSVPQSASLTSTGSGTYVTQRINSEDSTSFETNITGLQPSSSELLFTGDFSRSGLQEIFINQNRKSITTSISAEITELLVSKSESGIQSGSGTYSLTGAYNEDSFTYEGSIIFNGDSTATVTINGTEYLIDLN